MITLALLLAAQPAPELVDKADEASRSYIACLFAKSREAQGAGLSAAEFRGKLANSCLAEEQSTRKLTIQILSARGEADSAGTAEQLVRDARDGVISTYESLPEFQSQLEEVAEICRQRPEACR